MRTVSVLLLLAVGIFYHSVALDEEASAFAEIASMLNGASSVSAAGASAAATDASAAAAIAAAAGVAVGNGPATNAKPKGLEGPLNAPYEWEAATRNSALQPPPAPPGFYYDPETRTRFYREGFSLHRKKHSHGAGGASKHNNHHGLEWESMRWEDLPSASISKKAVVSLRNAPGALPATNGDILPRSLFPRPGCKDPEQIAAIKEWAKLTQEIKHHRVMLLKYKKWSIAARASLKKIAAQAARSKRNVKILHQGIRGMKHQREQIIKRLKSYQLKEEIEAAQARMVRLQEVSRELGPINAPQGPWKPRPLPPMPKLNVPMGSPLGHN